MPGPGVGGSAVLVLPLEHFTIDRAIGGIFVVIQQRIENYWITRADGYSQSIREELNSFKREAWQKLISEHAGQGDNIEALDIGTGPGFFAILMSDLGYKVTAVDCTEYMLQEAGKNTENAGFYVHFVKADAHKLPFLDNAFDLIVCRNLVWTLTNPQAVYQEWYRVLKKSGKVLVFDANWYLRLNDASLQEKYEKAMKMAEEMGYQDAVTREQEIECEDIARNLPLSYELRPEWDKKALLECGFQNVFVDVDISDKIYDEVKKVLYSSTPMFMICAQK